MHGRIKVRTTEEQRVIKEKENQKKLAAYRHGMQAILEARKNGIFDAKPLGICAQILAVNPDIYTLWNYRKEAALLKLKESKIEENGESGDSSKKNILTYMEDELKLTEHCLIANPKSYGSWHHRYWILQNHPEPNYKAEFDLCTKYLMKDDRNFHCWDYYRLIIAKVEVTLEEALKFSLDRINTNFSNYSSWHYRSTLRKLDDSCIDSELTLVQNAVFTDPADSSAWFYLRWVLSNPGLTEERKREVLDALDQLEELEPDCKWILMAKCWLTGSLCLNDKSYIDNRMRYYKRLMELDPMRKGQYQDYLETASEKIKLNNLE